MRPSSAQPAGKRTLSVDRAFDELRLWFPLCDATSQREVLAGLLEQCEPGTVDRVRALLRPLVSRDVAYQIELKHEIPDRVRERGSSMTMLEPDLAKGFRGRSLPSITGWWGGGGLAAGARSAGSSATVSSRSSRGSSASLMTLPRCGSIDENRRWSARERRERASSATATLSTRMSGGLATTRRSGPVIPDEAVQPRVDAGRANLLTWAAGQDASAHLMLFRQLMPYCALTVLHSLSAELATLTSKPVSRRAAASVARQTAPEQARFDIVGELPMHLAKQILSQLNFDELEVIKLVSHTWMSLAHFVRRDKEHRRDADDFMLNLKPVPDPHYIGTAKVKIPHPSRLTEVISFEADERNVFCGPYSVITVDGARKEMGRTAHYCGGKYVLTGSKSKTARLWDSHSGQLARSFHGHAGRIEAVHIDEAHCAVLTGSYDTSIRLWNTETGRCETIFGGEHKSTILCIDANYDAGVMVAGSADKHMSVWRLPTRGFRKPSRGPATKRAVNAVKMPLHYGMEAEGIGTAEPMLISSFLHDGEVRAIRMHRNAITGACTAVSGTTTGSVRLFDLDAGVVMRVIADAHTGAVTCVDLDNHRLYCGGLDRFVKIHAAAYVDSIDPSVPVAADDVENGNSSDSPPNDAAPPPFPGMAIMAAVRFRRGLQHSAAETIDNTSRASGLAKVLANSMWDVGDSGQPRSLLGLHPQMPAPSQEGGGGAGRNSAMTPQAVDAQSTEAVAVIANPPLQFMRHTTEVLCLRTLQERIVTGCKDGKVRIWSVTTGSCIRIFRGNSKCDPLVNITFLNSDSMCINTVTSMHVFWFDTGEDPPVADDDICGITKSATGLAIKGLARSDAADESSTKVMVAAPKPQAPFVRPKTARAEFAGQWRSDPRVRQRPTTAPANGRGGRLGAETIWHLHDGCVSIEMREKERTASGERYSGQRRPVTANARSSVGAASRRTSGTPSTPRRPGTSRTSKAASRDERPPFRF